MTTLGPGTKERTCCHDERDHECCKLVAALICVCLVLSIIPLSVGISFITVGNRQNMRSSVGQLVSASPDRAADSTYIRQKYLLYPFDVNNTDAFCFITRFKQYHDMDKIEAVVANHTAYGSTRRVWLDNTRQHVCYDEEETSYYFAGGVASLTIAGTIFTLGCCLPFSLYLFHRRYDVSDPVPTDDIEMAELDVGLK
jgi:hypothetical protein